MLVIHKRWQNDRAVGASAGLQHTRVHDVPVVERGRDRADVVHVTVAADGLRLAGADGLQVVHDVAVDDLGLHDVDHGGLPSYRL